MQQGDHRVSHGWLGASPRPRGGRRHGPCSACTARRGALVLPLPSRTRRRASRADHRPGRTLLRQTRPLEERNPWSPCAGPAAVLTTCEWFCTFFARRRQQHSRTHAVEADSGMRMTRVRLSEWLPPPSGSCHLDPGSVLHINCVTG